MAYDPERDRFLLGVVQVQVDGSKSTILISIHSYLTEDDEPGEPKLSIVRKIDGKKGERITDLGRMTEAEARGLANALTPDVVKRAFEEAHRILASEG